MFDVQQQSTSQSVEEDNTTTTQKLQEGPGTDPAPEKLDQARSDLQSRLAGALEEQDHGDDILDPVLKTDRPLTEGMFSDDGMSVDSEKHRLCFEVVDGELVLGVHSTWEPFVVYLRDYFKRMGSLDFYDGSYNGVFKDVDLLVVDVQKEAEKTHQAAMAMSRVEARAAWERFAAYQATRMDQIVAHLNTIPEDMHEQIERYGVAQPLRKKESTADPSEHTYYTGKTAGDAIPIVWYKQPRDYPAIQAFGETLQPFSSNPTVTDSSGATHNFGVSDDFKVRIGTIVRKSSSGSRTVQKKLNQVLADGGYDLSAHNQDGDHVTDLGFGGSDQIENYWPLDSKINRSAFFEYNGGYVINYKDDDGGYAAASIGMLKGRYFMIVDYQSGGIPSESDTEHAGTMT